MLNVTSHIWNFNIPVSKLLNNDARKYPPGQNSFHFQIIGAERDKYFEIERAEFTNCSTTKKQRIKGRLKASKDKITKEHKNCGMSASLNRTNLKDAMIDHLDGDRIFLVTETNRGTFYVHTDGKFPDVPNKDDIPCITVNITETNNSLIDNPNFEIVD